MRGGRKGLIGVAMAAVCTWCTTAVGAIAVTMTGSPSTSFLGLAASSGAQAGLVAAVDPNRCVTAFSKDICEGSLNPGLVNFGTCTIGGVNCRTVCVDGATWSMFLQSNLQFCSNNGLCDESPKKDGKLNVSISYIMRLHDPCPYRACFSGRWELQAIDGTIYQGEVFGTIGVGSHRPSACPFGGRNCERCLDVSLAPFDPATWRLGVEAQFRGQRVFSPIEQRDELCFSLSGDFFAPVQPDTGDPDFKCPWRFYGTADGARVHCTP